MGNPQDFASNIIVLEKGQRLSMKPVMHALVCALYSRHELEFNRGNFRVKGDTLDIFPAYADYAYRVIFFDDEIESLETFNPLNGQRFEMKDQVTIFPANLFTTDPSRMQEAIKNIQLDLGKQVEYFKEIGKHLEAKRLEDRVTYDVEMMKELGYCSGIENYSRYLDGRETGSRPFCLLDYFPKDFVLVVDESHVTISQIHAMYGGDRSRKINLVEYGFRLPAALDNRPLKYEEFEKLINQTIYVSATPADFELQQSGGVVVEQLIRPTGLLDPVIEVRPSQNQVDDLLDEIEKVTGKSGRTLVTTLTKRQAEELTKYLINVGVKTRYIHSDVETLERVEILQDLRAGSFDVLVGVNLLREGLDLPEVALVAIMDADKEGFLRSTRSLTQTAGRAARNVEGLVIMYADKITKSMQQTIDETNRRREKQLAYNTKHNITPTQIIKSLDSSLVKNKQPLNYYVESEKLSIAADPVVQYMTKDQLQRAIQNTRKQMEAAVKELDFMEAARLRDEIVELEKRL
jgi:excinuclease ABC subunit B